MLAPRASGAFVCLRCEVQLARPRLAALGLARRPPPPPPPPPPSHANFSTCSRRHDAADQAEPPPSNGLRITRVRRRRDKTVSQTTAKLGGIKQLGDDADILVISEVADADKPSAVQPPVKFVEPELLQVPDILSSLQHEDSAVTPEDIYNQLETLRPKTDADPGEPLYVSQKTFVRLVRILTEAFTAQQLSHFYSVAKNVQEENVYKDVLQGLKTQKDDAQHSPQRTDWHPGTTPLTRRLPGSGIGRRAGRTSVSKPLLVDRILRDVWSLELLEEIEAPGELELTLSPWQLALLNAGDKETPLSNIGKSRRAKIEIHWQHGVLRITADKNTAEYAANDVEATLRDIETKKLDLKPWTPYLAGDKLREGGDLTALYKQRDLDTIASITRANVQRVDDHQLVIRGLDKSSVEEAERTLISLLPLTSSAARTIDSRKLDATNNGSYLLPTFDDGKSLDHTFRSTRLGRWSLPITRSSDPATARNQRDDKTAAEEPVKLDRSISRLVDRAAKTLTITAEESSESTTDSREPGEPDYWSVEPEYKLSAEFGQVLFPLQNTNPKEAVKTALSQTSQSPFWPSIPGLANILTSADLSTTARTETPSLLYNFVPAPKQQTFEHGQTFPSLQIQVRASRHGGKANIHKISLGFQEHVHDVLLPDQASDIRFYRYGRLRYNKNFHDKNIAEWSDAVCDNIESGGRLTAPSLCIEVPNWLLSNDIDHAKATRSVNYLFTGIQFRQTVTGSYMGSTVSYSTVQAGKLGAKGGSLTSYYELGANKSLRDEQEIKAWIKTCLLTVKHITEAGSKTVPVSKILNPRREDSERKWRRTMIKEEGTASLGTTTTDGHGTIHHAVTDHTDDPSLSSILASDPAEPSLESPDTDTLTENEAESPAKEDDIKPIESSA